MPGGLLGVVSEPGVVVDGEVESGVLAPLVPLVPVPRPLLPTALELPLELPGVVLEEPEPIVLLPAAPLAPGMVEAPGVPGVPGVP